MNEPRPITPPPPGSARERQGVSQPHRSAAIGSGKVAVLVMGMHRSGTSVVAGLTNALGCQSPRTLQPASQYNPKGYFESEPIFKLNDEILAAAGSHWSDWRPLAPGWWSTPRLTEFKERAQALLEQEYGEATLISLKDPRLCRLLPLWREVLEEAGFSIACLHVHRHPTEVAISLERRVNIAVQRGVGQLSWLRHALDAEEHSRDLPRVFVSYEDVLRDWRPLRERSEQVFGPIWTTTSATVERRIADLIDPGLRHHGGEVGRSSVNLPDELQVTLDVLESWARGGESEDGRVTLEHVRARLDQATPLFSGALAFEERSAREAGALKQALERERSAAESAKAEAESARANLAALEGEIQDCIERLVERDRIIATTRRDYDQLRHQAKGAEAALHHLYRRSLSWRLSAPIRLLGRAVARFRALAGRNGRTS